MLQCAPCTATTSDTRAFRPRGICFSPVGGWSLHHLRGAVRALWWRTVANVSRYSVQDIFVATTEYVGFTSPKEWERMRSKHYRMHPFQTLSWRFTSFQLLTCEFELLFPASSKWWQNKNCWLSNFDIQMWTDRTTAESSDWKLAPCQRLSSERDLRPEGKK